jgi:hypothetical protein
MKARPLSVTIVSWLFVLLGSISLVSGLLPFAGANAAQLIAEFKTHWMVHLAHLASLVGGLFMLRGHNWARWLVVAWMVFHLVIGALNGWLTFLTHAVIFSVIFYFLFRRTASEYFAGPALANSH